MLSLPCKLRHALIIPSVTIVLFIIFCEASAQERTEPTESELILKAARELMTSVRYCGLITVDARSRPQIRTMDPFLPDENMVVWLATNPKSRKVRSIRKNPKVTLYYADAQGDGYVTLDGTARLVNDPGEKAKRWKPEWQAFYTDRDSSYLLIEVRPQKLEVVSYKYELTGDPVTWAAPAIKMPPETKVD